MQISQNPSTEEILKEVPELTEIELEEKLARATRAQKEWANTPFSKRAELFKKLALIFRDEKEAIGKMIALEMGRPLAPAIAESEKSAWACEYYADNAERLLTPESFPEGAGEGEIRFEPLGVILAVMPWNYPFWQVVRFAAPSLMAGNGGLLKHASNVPQSAAILEELFLKAGFPEGIFQNLPISIPQTATVIDDPRVAAVTLTGSVRAGTSVGERAGRNLKKIVLELGGSDPFIVLKDADIAEAARVGAVARLQNAGQTCIAAKRFVVEKEIADVFLNALKAEFEKYTVGDPMDANVMVGPLATKNILDGVSEQVRKSVEMGAKVVIGGTPVEGKGFFYMPTILTNLKKGMPAYDEEIFGPVASIIPVESEEEAIIVANDTEFGLGASIWTKDIEKAKRMAGRIEAGAVFINAQVKSDPRLPFGGVKKSGHGRELGEYGVKEFVNAKTVSISRPK